MRHGVVRLEHFGFELAEASVEAEHRRLADDDVNVAGPLLDAGLQ
jgi:hypothetical protein